MRKAQQPSVVKCPQVLKKIILELVMSFFFLRHAMHYEESLNHVSMMLCLNMFHIVEVHSHPGRLLELLSPLED